MPDLTDTERAEYEANWFAVAFLMPKDDFRRKWTELDGRLYEVAEYFGVPVSIAQGRAQALGLL